MSTQALLNVQCCDGVLRSSYVHFDGDSLLPLLNGNYRSQEQAEDLVSLGDASYLAESMAPRMGQRHSFDNPVEGVCVFYGRDRGEEDTGPAEYKSLKEAHAVAKRRLINYVYDWEGEKWTKRRP